MQSSIIHAIHAIHAKTKTELVRARSFPWKFRNRMTTAKTADQQGSSLPPMRFNLLSNRDLCSHAVVLPERTHHNSRGFRHACPQATAPILEPKWAKGSSRRCTFNTIHRAFITHAHKHSRDIGAHVCGVSTNRTVAFLWFVENRSIVASDWDSPRRITPKSEEL